jgi:BirA family biotin operon repressor/biotin-[acetyl-CoA-carboxylase] ligase
MSWNCLLERVATTQSTNDDLLARWRAGTLEQPVARIARQQTAGKGRAGRVWLAQAEDTLCFSLAYPFSCRPHALSGLSLVIGLCVINGIAAALGTTENALFDQGLRLKWPNDLLLNNAKLGGILIEGGQVNPSSPTWMIIGVGLNIQNETALQQKLEGQSAFGAAALEQLVSKEAPVPDIEFIWLKIIDSFEKYLTEFERSGFTPFKDAWERWDAFRGQAVYISGAGTQTLHGIASGVDSSGALLLNQPHQNIAIHAGDVSLRMQL